MKRLLCVAMTVTVAGALLAGCTGSKSASLTAAPTPSADADPVTLAVTPAARSTSLPVSTEIGVRVAGGSVDTVRLVDRRGHAVAGAMRDDRTSWVPAAPLAYHQTYTATVTAVGARRQHVTKTTTFTTMADPPQRVGTGMYVQTGETYGVGMPVAVEILRDVPAKLRASVQRRLFVTSSPAQPGAWHWYSPQRVEYRPATWWQPGTKLTVRIALGGLPLGGDWYGDMDRTATASIAKTRVDMRVTNSPKRMQVYENGKLTRTFPVSLGKPDAPSSSGHMVVMAKAAHTVFDTRGIPGENYVAPVDDAQRLTWGGEFIHSAPWSVGDQGYRNVSHGCVNVGPGNARWLFEQTHVGDPVTVTGTGTKLASGNGWTGWDMNWSTYIKGSALPVAKDVADAPAYNPYPTP